MNERLEEIKISTWNICECETCYCENFKPQMIAVDPKHFEWLIEQAERVQELEKKLNITTERGAKLAHKNVSYKQALEFYANEKNYERAYDDEVLFDYLPSEIDFDNGKKARKALEREG